MEIFFGLNKLKRITRPVVALGVFDGVHRGHRLILKSTVRKALDIGGTSVVVTFWPHPQKKESLYSLFHRLRLIAELGIEICIVIRFDRAFSAMPAEEFVRSVLVDRISAAYVYVGENFRFGRGARGGRVLLGRLALKYGFKVRLFGVLKIKDLKISSTLIRKMIVAGDLERARIFLGRRVSVLGTVIRGKAVGRRIGFPTANIDPHHEVTPPSGIYAVRVIFEGGRYGGVCYIGIKPEFSGRRILKISGYNGRTIEVYIFDFNKNIYNKDIEIQFIAKLRDEARFESPLSLAAQIKKDAVKARSLLARLR
jgi:riboflavin kinase/FMN adenylyltransferase